MARRVVSPCVCVEARALAAEPCSKSFVQLLESMRKEWRVCSQGGHAASAVATSAVAAVQHEAISLNLSLFFPLFPSFPQRIFPSLLSSAAGGCVRIAF